MLTGDRRGSGTGKESHLRVNITDANVTITLFGSDGDSGVRKLEGHGNLFERAHTDTFGFDCVELGELTKIRLVKVIWHYLRKESDTTILGSALRGSLTKSSSPM